MFSLALLWANAAISNRAGAEAAEPIASIEARDAVAIVGSMAPVQASDARWRVRTASPFAVRGGVLAIELEPLDPPASWPESLAVTGEGGVQAIASLGVVIATPSAAAQTWTTPEEPTEVLTPAQWRARASAAPAPGEARLAGAVVALVAFPQQFEGTVTVADSIVRPRWIAPAPATDSAPTATPARAPTGADDSPDAHAPGEFWRRVLMARARNEPAPAPPFDGPSRQLARHRAELWLAGLARVERASPSVAAALVELLTACVEDPQRPEGSRSVAAWISRTSELDALLAILLDPQRNPESSMRAALGWMESRTPLTFWLESDAGASVTLAVANPLPEEVVVRCRWVEAPGEAPVAILVPARTLMRQSIDRPLEAAPSFPQRGEREPQPRWRSGRTLRLDCGGWKGRIAAGPGIFAVRPPGLAFASFVSDLTLAEAQSQLLELPPTPWRTTASVRKLGTRWEIFVECLRPSSTPGDRLEISIRRDADSLVRFSVDESGTIATLDGAPNAELVAHARSHADRWRVRLELPEAWIPAVALGEFERVLELSMCRFPGAGQGRQSAGLAIPPWRPPAPIRADLAAWQDMPPIGAR